MKKFRGPDDVCKTWQNRRGYHACNYIAIQKSLHAHRCTGRVGLSKDGLRCKYYKGENA